MSSLEFSSVSASRRAWLLALACALFVGYFWVAFKQAELSQQRYALIADTLDEIRAPENARSPHRLVRVQQLMPELVRLGLPLPNLPRTSASLSGIGISDAAELNEVFRRAGVLVGYRLTQNKQAERRYLHLFYWSLIGLMLSVIGGVVGRRSSGRRLLDLLRQDAYLFARAPIGISISDAQDRCLRANAAYEELTGCKEIDLLGRPCVKAADADMYDALADDGVWEGDQVVTRPDGTTGSERVLRVAVGDSSERPSGYITMSLETVHSDEQNRLMIWKAHHDNLTKLPNANLLSDRLGWALQRMRGDTTEDSVHGALLSIDLDHFRQVNDAVGHEAGDRVLMDAALRIAMSARENDVVARVGGDQFVVAMLDLDELSEVDAVARGVIEQFEQPFIIGDREVFLTASVGIALMPTDGTEQGELLQKADAARLGAKERGGGQVAYFENQMNSAAARRLEIEQHLRHAIENDELSLNFQPVVDCGSGAVSGAEALLRWNSAALGQVSPYEFISVAEATDLIVPLGLWVVNEVDRVARLWDENPEWPKLRYSLNVSPRQFARTEQTQALLDALAAIDPSRITLEVTESALIANDQTAKDFLGAVKQQGMKVALDDFGTGYSSIGYLKDFEFDFLKIDKSFIDSIDGARDLGLVASIISMSRIMGMKVVAEGVEDEPQHQALMQIGCDLIQGYYFSKPLAAEDFERYVLDAGAAPGAAVG